MEVSNIMALHWKCVCVCGGGGGGGGAVPSFLDLYVSLFL